MRGYVYLLFHWRIMLTYCLFNDAVLPAEFIIVRWFRLLCELGKKFYVALFQGTQLSFA
jgi:hypothetical protein